MMVNTKCTRLTVGRTFEDFNFFLETDTKWDLKKFLVFYILIRGWEKKPFLYTIMF